MPKRKEKSKVNQIGVMRKIKRSKIIFYKIEKQFLSTLINTFSMIVFVFVKRK